MLKRLFLILTLVLMSGSFMVKAQESFNVEDILPDKTMIYISTTNIKKFYEDSKTTGVYKYFDSPEFAQFFKSIDPKMLEKAKKGMEKVERVLEAKLEKIFETFVGSGQFSIVLQEVI